MVIRSCTLKMRSDRCVNTHSWLRRGWRMGSWCMTGEDCCSEAAVCYQPSAFCWLFAIRSTWAALDMALMTCRKLVFHAKLGGSAQLNEALALFALPARRQIFSKFEYETGRFPREEQGVLPRTAHTDLDLGVLGPTGMAAHL